MAMTEKPGLSKAIPKEITAEARAPAGPTPTSKDKAKAMAMAMAEDLMVIDASMMIDASMVTDASMTIEDSKIHHRETKAKARAQAGTT